MTDQQLTSSADRPASAAPSEAQPRPAAKPRPPRQRPARRFEVGPVSEIPPGARKIVNPRGNLSIGIFNINGSFYALKNTCPHMGGPLCAGLQTGTTRATTTPDGRFETEWIRDNEIIACPWHHWEFDILTGKTVFPSRQRVATYEVTVEDIARMADARVETYPVVVESAMVYLELR
ncbi:MAG TPA: Rieske (2Fe-2S) protein [Streptosporangiaceae bacterium]